MCVCVCVCVCVCMYVCVCVYILWWTLSSITTYETIIVHDEALKELNKLFVYISEGPITFFRWNDNRRMVQDLATDSPESGFELRAFSFSYTGYPTRDKE